MSPAAQIPILGAEVILAVILTSANPGGQLHDLLDAHLFSMLIVFGTGHLPMPQIIHIDFFKKVIRQLPNHAPLTHSGLWIVRGMTQNGIGVQARCTTKENVMNLDVESLDAVVIQNRFE